MPQVLQKALEPGSAFDPIPTPGPSDWLANHREPGQTFEQFIRFEPNRPDDNRHTLYLQPLGAFESGRSPSTDHLIKYTEAFFTMKVKLLPPLDPADHELTTRLNPSTQNPQILTGDVLALLRSQLPQDAFCRLAITMVDLYPDPDWNFVFGQATYRDRVGVFSFARYDPEFYGQPRDPDYETTLLRRSCAVLAHEAGHMFGLAHCIYFHCLMNGSNNLAESDAQPLHLCPVCLRKLQHSIGFDVLKRYQTLHAFYERLGFKDEAAWTHNRLQWLQPAESQE